MQTNKQRDFANQGDTISRQAAIDFVGSMEMCDEISAEAYKKLTNYFEDMPSAQQNCKTDHGYMWLCPECGLTVHSDYDRCVRCGWERRTDEGD